MIFRNVHYNRFMNLLDFVFPRRCINCGKIGKYFCDTCRLLIRPVADNERICPMCGRLALDGITHPGCKTRYSLDGLTSFFHYGGVVQKAVKAIKYRFVSDLAQEFISLIPNLPSPIYDLRSVLVPIPLHPTRLRFRGFNQAELLGSILAKRVNIPLQKNILKRTKYTVPQVEMKERKKRLENMEHVFSCSNLTMKQYNNIFLFDDVFTTGATLRSAANVLKRAGAHHVWGITMAR